MADEPVPFISLKSLTQGPPDPAAAIAEIRQIYFKTTRGTIEHDFAHAIELLKSIPDEDQRERATVYMEGLAQMQREWQTKVRSKKSEVRSKSGSGKSGSSTSRRPGSGRPGSPASGKPKSNS